MLDDRNCRKRRSHCGNCVPASLGVTLRNNLNCTRNSLFHPPPPRSRLVLAGSALKSVPKEVASGCAVKVGEFEVTLFSQILSEVLKRCVYVIHERQTHLGNYTRSKVAVTDCTINSKFRIFDNPIVSGILLIRES